MEPSIVAAAPSRTQMSCAIWFVIWLAGATLINRRSCCTCSSSMIFRKGDCSSCSESPCRSVPSNTVSPVVFVKSARTMVSLSVSACAWRVKNNQPHTASPTITIVAAATAPHRVDFRAGFLLPALFFLPLPRRHQHLVGLVFHGVDLLLYPVHQVADTLPVLRQFVVEARQLRIRPHPDDVQ